MSDSARRKEKQRLKRKQKQLALRKSRSVSPLQRIGSSGGRLDCWINGNWKDQGMISMFVLGEGPGGHLGMAAFLIDNWCVGLKDAWGRTDITRQEFQKQFIDGVAPQMEMTKINHAEARRLVAAGIRFARQNAFRLPPHYDRWTAIFGDLGDIASADLTGFKTDGPLVYMGTHEFLRQRYTGGTVEQFLSRPDVQWITPPDDLPFSHAQFEQWEEQQGAEEGEDEDSDELPEELADEVTGAIRRGVQDVRQWCARNGIEPHPRLGEAMTYVIGAIIGAAALGEKNPSREALGRGLDEMMKLHAPKDPEGLEEAALQIFQSMKETGSSPLIPGQDDEDDVDDDSFGLPRYRPA